MKVLGFAVIAMGIIIVYIGVTGSQHRVMGLILSKSPKASGKSINPTGTGNTSSNKKTTNTNPPGGVTLV